MPDANCSNCGYCVEARQGHEIQKQYLCYRNPPVPFPVPAQGGIAVMSLRPVVSENDWCGEYDHTPWEPDPDEVKIKLISN